VPVSELSPSQTTYPASPSIFHIIENKPGRRNASIEIDVMDEAKEIRIESNIDRNRRLRVFAVDSEGSKHEIVYNENEIRIHHKSSFVVLKLEKLDNVTKIVIVSEYGNKKESERSIMNLSPTFDKTNPTIYKPA
jgi:hypothetical protein